MMKKTLIGTLTVMLSAAALGRASEVVAPKGAVSGMFLIPAGAPQWAVAPGLALLAAAVAVAELFLHADRRARA